MNRETERVAAAPAIQLLIVDDEAAYRRVLQRELERRGHAVVTAGSSEEGLALLASGMPDVVLLDLRMAGVGGLGFLHELRERGGDSEVIILTGYPSLESAVEAVRAGIFDYRTKPIDLDTLEGVVRRAAERRALLRENLALRHALVPSTDRSAVPSASPTMLRFSRSLPRIAASTSTVLIHGETGAGKELVARELHRLSPRRDEPLVVIDCAALQSSVRGAELFGCEKGAFTGAEQARPGLFEAAHRGTVFLDEIGELDLEAQAALLRVLESGEIRRVGATKSRPLDVRVIAATHRDLAAEVAARRFREDLLFRLQVVQLDLPPLRDRSEDILPLFDHFLARAAGAHAPRLADPVRDALLAYRWPGNVREVRNLAEMLAVTVEGATVELADLPRRIVAAPGTLLASGGGALAGSAVAGAGMAADGTVETLAALERRQILAVYELSGRNKRRAAELLGISLRTLYNKLAEYLGSDPQDRAASDSGPVHG